MEYLSKTYRLDTEVIESIERAKAGGTSPNKFLRMLMGLDSGPDVGQGAAASVPATPSVNPTVRDPAEIPGVTRGFSELPARPETLRERLAREKAEKEARIRARSSIGDDPSFDPDPEYSQD